MKLNKKLFCAVFSILFVSGCTQQTIQKNKLITEKVETNNKLKQESKNDKYKYITSNNASKIARDAIEKCFEVKIDDEQLVEKVRLDSMFPGEHSNMIWRVTWREKNSDKKTVYASGIYAKTGEIIRLARQHEKHNGSDNMLKIEQISKICDDFLSKLGIDTNKLVFKGSYTYKRKMNERIQVASYYYKDDDYKTITLDVHSASKKVINYYVNSEFED